MKRVYELKDRRSEHGGAGVKLLIFAIALFLIVHGLYNYGMTAYQAANIQQDMHTAIVQGVTLPKSFGKPKDITLGKLKRVIQINELPPDTFVEVKEESNIIKGRIYYEKTVAILPFGIYDYNYVFDHTATPGDFINQ